MAISRSACSVLVGMPVLGPRRCTLMTTSGSSVITARPRPSAFNERPGPLVPVTPMAPAERGTDGGNAGGDLVLGLQRAYVVLLVLGQLVQDLAGRRDWIAGIDKRSAGARARPQPGRAPPLRCPSPAGIAPSAIVPPQPCVGCGTVRRCRRSCTRPARLAPLAAMIAGFFRNFFMSHSSTG